MSDAVHTRFQLSSPGFKPGGPIPSKYACDGRDVSPPLQWGAAPEGARTLALIVDDPDAPGRVWVHWLLYNLPAATAELRENVSRAADLPEGALEGVNDFRKTGYGGPCPPGGTHRYFFRLYALDTTLSLPPKARRSELDEAMKGHVLAQAELMGTYSR